MRLDRSYVKFTPNGKYLLAAYLDSTLRLWNHEQSRCVRRYTGHTADKYSAACAFFLGAGDGRKRVVSGSEDGRVCVWDVDTQEMLPSSWQAHSTPVLGVCCGDQHSAARLCLATGAMAPDCTTRLWRWKEPQ